MVTKSKLSDEQVEAEIVRLSQRIPLYTEEALTEKLKQLPSVGEFRAKQEGV